MSSEETQELINDCPEELQSLLLSENFKEVSIYFNKLLNEDLSKGTAIFQICIDILIQSSKYEQVLDLVSTHPDLFEGPWPSSSILNRYFFVVNNGETQELQLLTQNFGIYPNIISKRGLNLFEESIFSKSLSMVRLVRESLGVESRSEKNLYEAASLGHKGILQYLYEELGIECTDPCKLVKCSIEAGSLECLQYIRNYMGIGNVKDFNVMEVAVYQAVDTHRIDILDYFITYFQIEFDPAKISPYKKHENGKKDISFFTSFSKAVLHNDATFILFALHAVKIRIGCSKSNSELLTYLELLNNCVKRNNLHMMKILIKHGKMCPAACLLSNRDYYVLTDIENSSLKKKDKIKMLKFLRKYEKEDEYDAAIRRITEKDKEVLDNKSLKKVKREMESVD